MDNQKLMLSTPPYRIGEVRILGVTTHKHDNGIINVEKNVDNVTIFFLGCEVNMTS